MARHRFGEGEYKYFAPPLPPLVAEPAAKAVPAARAGGEPLGGGARRRERFPPSLDGLLDRCARAGQARPTPLVLRYREGGYNCLHQDVYGEITFPLQALIPLSRPGVDFTGGEFLLVEQRPRAQSRRRGPDAGAGRPRAVHDAHAGRLAALAGSIA